MDALLGVDAGPSRIKAVARTPTGDEHAIATHSVPTQHSQPQWAEQDMAIVWDRTAGCLSQVVGQLPSDARIRGLSIAGQGDGCWLVDEAGEPVRNAILWSDSRAADYVSAWSKTGVCRDIEQVCGSGLFPGTALPLLAWLADEEPDRLTAAATLFFCKDWLTYKLTDQRATELSDASLPLLDIRAQSDRAVRAHRSTRACPRRWQGQVRHGCRR
jgi:erythritol kinase